MEQEGRSCCNIITLNFYVEREERFSLQKSNIYTTLFLLHVVTIKTILILASDSDASTGVATDDDEAILTRMEAASTDDGREALAGHPAQPLTIGAAEELDSTGLLHAANDKHFLARHGGMPLCHKGRQPAAGVVIMADLRGGLDGARLRVHIIGKIEVVIHGG